MQQHLSPFIKCAGGKRDMIKYLKNLVPKAYTEYYEPFLGGASLFLYLRPNNAVISDINFEITNLFTVIRDDLAELKLLADHHLDNNGKDYYYQIRELDKDQAKFAKLTNIERAARFFYLNKTCFGGLTRYNKKGEFNVPFYPYKNPCVYRDEEVDPVSNFLLARKDKDSQGQVSIKCCDFEEATKDACFNSFVYFDPPYLRLSKTSSFSGYHKSGFKYPEHERLRDHCDRLIDKGCQVMISNSDTKEVRELYQGDRYIIHQVASNRSINSDTTKRGTISELIITSHYQTKGEIDG